VKLLEHYASYEKLKKDNGRSSAYLRWGAKLLSVESVFAV
jgi:hypothetical protein